MTDINSLEGKVYSAEYIKNEILNILKVFRAFCEKHELGFVLVYGTLLGAVRHEGFIPWDDDIDVGMLAEDYVKLEQIAGKEPFLDDGRRYRFAVPGDKNYPYPFMKVIDTKYVLREKNIADRYNIGLYIDIFRIDYWPENAAKEWFQLKKAHTLLRINEICIRGNIAPESRYALLDKLLRPVDVLFRIFGISSDRICRAIDRTAAGNRPSGFMGVINEATGKKREKQPEQMYRNTVILPFEGDGYPAPADYDSYLKRIYGDYMTLPDPSQRVGHEFDIISEREIP